jgi:hypothetical protein
MRAAHAHRLSVLPYYLSEAWNFHGPDSLQVANDAEDALTIPLVLYPIRPENDDTAVAPRTAGHRLQFLDRVTRSAPYRDTRTPQKAEHAADTHH